MSTQNTMPGALKMLKMTSAIEMAALEGTQNIGPR